MSRSAAATHAVQRFSLARLIFAVPLLGGMLRELTEAPERALPGFVLNLLLLMILLTVLFGFGVVMIVYLALAPAMLGLIILMSSDFGRSL